jgi:hypothetical protein
MRAHPVNRVERLFGLLILFGANHNVQQDEAVNVKTIIGWYTARRFTKNRAMRPTASWRLGHNLEDMVTPGWKVEIETPREQFASIAIVVGWAHQIRKPNRVAS